MDFFPGDRVKHPTLEAWGLGEVVDVGERGRIRVFFTGVGEKRLVMPHVKLQPVSGAEAQHVGLDNLRVEPANKRIEYRKMEDLIEAFRAQWPGGFEDPGYLESERAPKEAAATFIAEQLPKSFLDEVLAEQSWDVFTKRILTTAGKTNLVYPNEKQALKQGLQDPQNAKFFVDKFKSLLYGKRSAEARFNDLVVALDRIKAPKWPLATYFLFMTAPTENMILKPRFTQQAADSCRFEINYDAFPNWETYSGLMRFSHYLASCLEPLHPKDMFDVQAFIWKTSQDA